MKMPEWLKCYGAMDFRGDCPPESAEQITFFAELRRRYPDTYGKLALHPKNEEKRKGKQFNRLAMDKALGMTPGASDIIIPLGFACEMKRQDHTKSKWQPGQLEYLKAVHDAGGFACVALGWKGAWEAFEVWLAHRNR
jgi:hypothetical protein